jgi:ankyrin repeat protein
MINPDFNKEIDKLYTITTKIFNLIKLQDWKNLESLIEKTDIDFNIKDNTNTWLLEYLITFNLPSIIKILLTKNVRLDIKDEQNRSILYSVIKFSYIPVLTLLLEKDKKIIGKSTLEISDSEQNIPLFYAIKFMNKEVIDIILKYQTNYYFKNSDGENALHLAIKSSDLDILITILKKIPDINIKKNNGETCLHISIKYRCYQILEYVLKEYNSVLNYNSTESKYNFTPLHYLFLSLDFELIGLFSSQINNFNPNIQDKSGNIFLHYFINNIIQNNTDYNKKNLLEVFDIIKNLPINYNLTNIDGNTPCHILLLNLKIFKKDYNILINHLVEKTNLNIQNKNGESCLFLLVKEHYWLEVINIIDKKKLDIFIKDDKSNTVFDYLDSDDELKFINLITNSYLYILSIEQNKSKWIDYWDNRCKKNVKLQELNDTEKDLLQNIKINTTDNVCYDIIYNKIKNFILDFKKNKKIYGLNSHPSNTKNIKLIEDYPEVITPTFTGSTIDVISGLMYLNIKYKSNLKTSLSILDLSSNIIVCTKSNICEFVGFEILWKNYQLVMPTSKSNDFTRLLIEISSDPSIRFCVIPLGIELTTQDYSYGHANILLFDFESMQVERFEPHGSEPPYGLDYNAHLLDNLLKNKIASTKLKFEYFCPEDYLPKIGFQIKEIYELKNDYIGDPNGFCAGWCLWWCDIRIKNSQINRRKLVNLLFREIINEEYSYKKLIRNYTKIITDYRDKLLGKINININDWINDTMTTQQKDKLELTYISEIKTIVQD